MDTCRQKKKGRPKTTWRKTAETELSEMGLSWGEAQATAKDPVEETLLWPHALLGAIRTDDDVDDDDDTVLSRQ